MGDFAEICRVCREPDDEGKTLGLFRVGLYRKMMACADVQVWQNDGLPGQICRRCAARLHVSYQFKRQCEKSDLLLRLRRDSKPSAAAGEADEPAASIDDPGEPFVGDDFDPSAFLSYIPSPLDSYGVESETLADSRIVDSQSLLSIDSLPVVEATAEISRPTDEPESFRCPVCDKAFSSLGKLNRHSRTHSDEVLYRCDVCNKGFIHGGNYKVHMRIHADERPFSCPVCEMRCRQRQDLKKHMRIHTGERPHVCSVCRRAFTTSSNLVAHRRTHTGEKPYVCPVCRKAFCQSNELSKHFRTHTGEKSHICPVCDKGFNGSSTLVVHMRTHTGERPYVCTICNKGFTQSSCLAVHTRQHTETHKHRCDLCPRSFSSAEELKLHIDAHGSAIHSCSVFGCRRSFSRPNDLLRHMKNVHDGS